MLKFFFIAIMIVHGLIHLMGSVKAFRLASLPQLTQDISKPMGLVWLVCSGMFLLAAAFFLLGKEWWWMTAIPAFILSQVLIVLFWKDARFGTVLNIIIIAGIAVGYGRWSFQETTRHELTTFLSSAATARGVVSDDVRGRLPSIVQRWLDQANVHGGRISETLRLMQRGEMRTSPDGSWMPVTAEQWSTPQRPGFFWLASVKAMPGINLEGRDKYESGAGEMHIRLLWLFPVADARGRETDQGAMVRYLAEIVWYPSAALSDYLTWEAIDSTSARATMTYGGVTASGVFTFDPLGHVVSFEAKRYYDRKGGATLEDWFVRIEPDSWKEFDGVRIPARSSVTWKLREGDFEWYRLEILELHFLLDSVSPPR